MRKTIGIVRTAAIAAGLLLLAGCGSATANGQAGPGEGGDNKTGDGASAPSASPASQTREIPGVGAALRGRIPADSRQVVAVYGKSASSADSTVVLYTKHGSIWKRERSWSAHNGRRGWTTDHHEGDKKSPVGVFTLSDAGGVLADPGSKLPYHRSASIAAPHYWAKGYWHDFDLVIAIDYNRVKGTAPNDPTRPQGQAKGGSIWLHMDHGSGTSACVSQSKSDMEYLLRTLDPAQHPVIVMGDKADLEV
jgi:L,D-peptidoglycan transpeptidase YkuD (ErfK/YbiS/YcfS/YnhG family)